MANYAFKRKGKGNDKEDYLCYSSSSCKVTNITYKVSGDDIYFYFTGEKTYDKHGNNYSGYCRIGWKLYDEAVPAFFAGVFMALCYSISYGIAAGFVFHILVKICKGKIKEINPVLWVCTALFVLNFVLLALI